jgi:N-acetylneuraminic acid mutarotase
MKIRSGMQNVKRNPVWIITILVFSGLLLFIEVSYAKEGVWVKKSIMPTPRYWAATCVLDGKIYVIGGRDQARMYSIVEEYDPETDIWTQKADLPSPRAFLSASVVNGKIYAIGGGVANPFGMDLSGASSKVEEYDPKLDKWTKKADMPTPRNGLSTSVVDGIIYAIGGWRAGHVSAVEAYDPATDKWVKKTPIPTARHSCTSVVDRKIYVIGGHWQPVLGVVEEYDPVTDRWTRKADMPTPRLWLSSAAVNEKIYAMGGHDDAGNILRTVEGYDPAADKWRKEPDMLAGRFALFTAAVNGKIYAMGGGGWGVAIDFIEEYDTGFVPQGTAVEAKGKLIATWCEIKELGKN